MKIAGLQKEVPIVLLVIFCLFGEYVAFAGGSFISTASSNVKSVFRDPAIQWIVVLSIGIYQVAFSGIRKRRLWGSIKPMRALETSRRGVLVISALVYFFNYQCASQSVQPVMLLGGALVGSMAWVNMFWRHEPGINRRSLGRFMTLTVLLLTIACFWKFRNGSPFAYQQVARRMGPWDNPNLYGMLMGSGMILATGLTFFSLGWANASNSRWKFWSCFRSALFLVAATALCYGLWKSYSRGAWLGACVGSVYLLIRWSKWRLRCLPLYTRTRSVAFALCAWLTLLFWQQQHTEMRTVQRAMSVSNQNDFSWRNRVIAWEGALQMIAERPWLGLGWNQPEPFYEYYYSPSKLDETMAIQMNDYLILGATLGIPALFCFTMYLWLTLTRNRVSGIQDSGSASLDWLKTTCLAGALVLAVGFWFDGGLFKLPTAATFWILLELGRG